VVEIMEEKEKYISPLSTRYASPEMQYIFSESFKFKTWRRLWISLAKAEQKLGLAITDEQIAEMEAHAEDINYEAAQAREKIVRHDVMSHVYAYGLQCPKAAGIIHLGATSCYVGDNTDVIILREASHIVLKKAAQVLKNLSDFALRYKDLPCLAYTHLQPAQLTTVGKRATLWMYELSQDIENLIYQLSNLKLLGSKGTTGTQASFVELFEGDRNKIKQLEAMIAEDMGFSACVPVSGQTYSRKVDAYFLSVLSGFAQSAYKFANDLRILQSFEEIEEPFEDNQIGSSAMPYKRNPMRSERICALARYVITDSLNPAFTSATQWFERTLDDSANKRISVAEAFLAIDAILNIYINVTGGLVVYDKVVTRRVMEKLPYMATENIMMMAVKKGGNRQELHELLREHSPAAAKRVKLEGGANDLIDRIAADPAFPVTREEIEAELDPARFTGCAPEQTKEFVEEVVNPILERLYVGDVSSELTV
jgi:adenylosuccinate lyase